MRRTTTSLSRTASYNITVENVKILITTAETDAFRICITNGISINNSFVLNNDDMLVIGECSGSAPSPPGASNNTVANSTFIKLGRAGNWFRQETSGVKDGEGGDLGTNNIVYNCDVVRLHGTSFVYQVSQVDVMGPIQIYNIRVTTPGMIFLTLNQSTPAITGGQYELSNIALPSSDMLPSIVAGAGFNVTLRNVTVGGILATSDAMLSITTVAPSTTTYYAD